MKEMTWEEFEVHLSLPPKVWLILFAVSYGVHGNCQKPEGPLPYLINWGIQTHWHLLSKLNHTANQPMLSKSGAFMKSGTGTVRSFCREKPMPMPFAGSLIHHSVDWHRGRLQSVAVDSHAAMDTDEQMSLSWTELGSLGIVPRICTTFHFCLVPSAPPLKNYWGLGR